MSENTSGPILSLQSRRRPPTLKLSRPVIPNPRQPVAAKPPLEPTLELKTEIFIRHQALAEAAVIDDFSGTIEMLPAADGNPRRLETGDVVGNRFEVIRELGQGGIGAVYLCRDLRDGSQVALKTSLKTGEDQSDQLLAMHLENEGKTLSILGRGLPNVVDCLARGADFIVLEYIAGRSLGDLIGSIPYENREQQFKDHAIAALQIIREVLVGLESAHDRGEVHGDISPHNVMVREDRGRFDVTLIDWGLGRSYEQRTPGTILGKASYMAPEQARGDDIDPRADVYSVGLLLYEALTGSRPFDGFDMMRTLRRRIDGKAFEMDTVHHWLNTLHLEPDLCTSVSDLLFRLTASRRDETDPGDGYVRFQSAFEARLAVERILADISFRNYSER